MNRRQILALPMAGFASHFFGQRGPAFIPDVELELTGRPGEHEIYPGRPTATWSYQAKLLKGRAGTLQPSDSYIGPAIHLQRGDKVRVHLHNELPESTIVHWHGLNVPESADGHPRLAIPHGGKYVYEFQVQDRAGLYWYHPHPHELTASQAYRGLAGPLFIHDDEEAALGLPSGDHEIPVVLQDRTFGPDQQLVYVASHMEAMNGFVGDRILVNGKAGQEWNLATGAYRLRFLNGSNSRIYKLAWSDGKPVTVIGTDGGLLERPLQKPYVTLAPGERADVILDLTARATGSSFELRSLPFNAPMRMMMGRMQMGSGLAQGAGFKVLGVRVGRKEGRGFRLPARLSQPGFRNVREAENPDHPRSFSLSFRQMNWFLNGSQFEMEAVKVNEIFKAGSTHVLEFSNENTGMMQMAHPIHLHGGQFQVLARIAGEGSGSMAASLRDGLTDEGWKDTVLVFPGEKVRVLMQFPKFKGLFLYHCHILEHEDMGMMRNFRVV